MREIITFIFLLMVGLHIIDIPEFSDRQNLGEVENNSIDEASGLVASRINPGILWTHNDSGGENRIFAVGTDGSNKGVFYIDGIVNRDWEDIEIGNGPEDKDYYTILDQKDEMPVNFGFLMVSS